MGDDASILVYVCGSEVDLSHCIWSGLGLWLREADCWQSVWFGSVLLLREVDSV